MNRAEAVCTGVGDVDSGAGQIERFLMFEVRIPESEVISALENYFVDSASSPLVGVCRPLARAVLNSAVEVI